MSAIEKRIKEAFDDVKMPQGLKEETLRFIEERTVAQNDSGYSVQDVSHDPDAAMRKPAQVGLSAHVKPAPSESVAKRTPAPFMKRFGFAIAACLLLCVIGFGGLNVYATETAVVGIEVNPSIELGINRFDMVVDARALNDDGAHVLDTVSVIGKSYDEALDIITQSDAFTAFVGEDSFMDISVLCDDDRQSKMLVDQGQTYINTLSYPGTCNRVDHETHKQAQERGMGVGRYEAAMTLISLDPTLSIKDCEAMSMKEIRIRIAEIDLGNEYAWSSDNQSQGGGDMHDNNQQGQGRGEGQGKQDDAQNAQGGSGSGSDAESERSSGNGEGQGDNPESGKGSQDGQRVKRHGRQT